MSFLWSPVESYDIAIPLGVVLSCAQAYSLAGAGGSFGGRDCRHGASGFLRRYYRWLRAVRDAIDKIADFRAQRAGRDAVQLGPVERVGAVHAFLALHHEVGVTAVQVDRSFRADNLHLLVNPERGARRQEPNVFNHADGAAVE